MYDNQLQLGKLPGWQPISQPPARLQIQSRPDALRLDYDFQGGGGFVVARLPLDLELSERFVFTLSHSGTGPVNQLEFKLADSDGNCWRYLDASFLPSQISKTLRLDEGCFAFAWGPAGFGAPGRINAIEIALVAVEGGQGSLQFEQLLFTDLGPAPRPAVRVSSQQPDWQPEAWWSGASPWQATATDDAPWLLLDFGEPRRLCALSIHWRGQGADTRLAVATGQGDWRALTEGLCPAGDRSWFWLGETGFERVRIQLSRPAAIDKIEWLKVGAGAGSRTAISRYFHWQASKAPPGWYPRHLLREQSYWTCLGTPEGQGSALINEEGQVELDEADALLDALLFVDGRLHGWAEARCEQRLDTAGLPLPEVRLRYESLELELRVRPLALHQCLVLEYELENWGAQSRQGRFMLALRPFQVTPIWQAGQRHFGGMGRLFDLCWSGNELRINSKRSLHLLPAPHAVGVSSSQRNEAIADLALGQVPPAQSTHDPEGWASGAFGYGFFLEPGEIFQASCLVPYSNRPQLELASFNQLGAQGRMLAAKLAWQSKFTAVPQVQIPAANSLARQAAAAATSAIGQSLIQRMCAALQPGARRYTRAWIRDGVVQCAALVRAGCIQEAAQYLEWYAGHQAADGRIPCCIDTSPDGAHSGAADWLVEHDSLGQFIFGIMEVWRFCGDRPWLARLWPSVELALGAFERLLQEPAVQAAGKGLLPPSASHEGYLAHPVQAYWDDFWALRGLWDALTMAEVLGKTQGAISIRRLLGAFEQDLARSLQAVISANRLDFIPGSVELADFDPSATATAIAWLDRLPGVSAEITTATFDRYMEGFRKRRDNQTPWQQYSAYEIRIIQALIRLGRRDEAHELLDYFLADRRPLAWNQWPEISWRDFRAPGHLGDLPHAWIGAEFFLTWQSLFAYECHSDQSLVIAAGIVDSWLPLGETLAIRGLKSYWGWLDISLQRTAIGLQLRLEGDYRQPPGGIHYRPPLRPGEQLLLIRE